jgi:cob(I)alamin adenosyltransferase
MTSKASLYTGYGDKGCTFTKKNPKTPKNDKLICLIGEIDDLNSHIGYLVYILEKTKEYEEFTKFQLRIQSLLFHIGAFLGYNTELKTTNLSKAIISVEYQIDVQEEKNEKLNNFILPGGTKAASFTHICRSKTRTVERLLCDYLSTLEEKKEINDLILMLINRMSDYYFSLARTINRMNQKKELLWKAESIEYDF